MLDKTTLTDQELVLLSLRERALFGGVVERYQARLRRYITRLGVKNPDDQEDVLQEIFIKVYRNLNSFDQSLSFSSWIYRIAHNEAISWYRKLKVRPEGYLVADPTILLELLSSEGEDPESRAERKLNADLIERALEILDEKYRTILVLRYFEHLEYEEISDVLRMPVGTVGTLIHRAKKQLRDELSKINHHYE
jgi:RNA polymerase sigma-70 factor (ECF subfamily)